MPPLKGGAVNVNIEGMPVPAFINEFFGSILGVGFQMDPQVARMQDLVTLRTQGPQSPQDFYRLAVQVLRTYGVSTEFSSGLVFFNRARDSSKPVCTMVTSVHRSWLPMMATSLLISGWRHSRGLGRCGCRC